MFHHFASESRALLPTVLLTQSFAKSLGQHLVQFECSKDSDPAAIGSFVQGAAMDGCFGCFDDAHLLSRASSAVLVSHIQAVLQALRSMSTMCYLSERLTVRMIVGSRCVDVVCALSLKLGTNSNGYFDR